VARVADGFKIADAFVEVEVDLDKRQVTRASVSAGKESGKHFGDGFTKETKARRGGLVGAVTKSLDGAVGAALKVGTKVGNGVVAGVTAAAPKLGASLSSALTNPYALAGVGVAAIALGAFIGAALNGAILAALGTGAVAAGIGLAARNPMVKAEAAALGETLVSGLTGAAQSFIAPVRDSIRYIKAEFRGMLPDIHGIFNEASRYVRPLTEAVIGFVREALPGIRTAIANLGPVFDMLKTELPELGRDVGDAFAMLSEHADGAASALGFALDLIGFGITNVTTALTALTMVWEGWANTPIGWLSEWASENDLVMHSARRLGTETAKVAEETKKAEMDTRAFITALDKLNQAAINAIDTEGAYQRAVDGVAAAKRNEHAVLVMSNGVLVQNTERQRAGAAAINDVAKAALAKAAAVHEATLKTGTLAQADAAARESIIKSRNEFITLATKLGLSAAAAQRLADELLSIPKTVNTTVTTSYRRIEGSGGRDVAGHAEGGLIRGPGTGTSDSIVRRVSDGEYVIRAAAVKRIGTKALDAMNNGGAMPAPAGGTSTAVMDRPQASRPPVIVNMAGANFYGVGTAEKYVAELYDAIDRYERRYR
jgi:hypothetical protein